MTSTPVSLLWSACSDCGRPYQRERSTGYCDECRPTRPRTVRRLESERARGTNKERGYGAAWRRLSRRARRLQPWCSDCGRTDELTADHSPEAWRRVALGKPVRLEDIDVVCRWCNADRGPARGPDAVDRPTMSSGAAELEALTEDGVPPDDLDQRVARGEL